MAATSHRSIDSCHSRHSLNIRAQLPASSTRQENLRYELEKKRANNHPSAASASQTLVTSQQPSTHVIISMTPELASAMGAMLTTYLATGGGTSPTILATVANLLHCAVYRLVLIQLW